VIRSLNLHKSHQASPPVQSSVHGLCRPSRALQCIHISATIMYKAPPLRVGDSDFLHVHHKLPASKPVNNGMVSSLLQILYQDAILKICSLHISTNSLDLLLRSRDETRGNLALGRVGFQPCAQPSIVSDRPSSTCPSAFRMSGASLRQCQPRGCSRINSGCASLSTDLSWLFSTPLRNEAMSYSPQSVTAAASTRQPWIS
jgi:hypothetical protein